MNGGPGFFVDGCVFHEWASTLDLAEYLSAGWRSIVARESAPVEVRSKYVHRNPLGAKSHLAYPPRGPAGSDLGLLLEQVFEPTTGSAPEKVVLSYDEGLHVTAFPNHRLATAMARAANEWTAERWLTADERLHGLVMICSATPEEAALEIRRAGRNPRMVGVLLGANVLGLPFGHAIYRPIHEAAAEMNLPLVLQPATDASVDLAVTPTAAGVASTYSEYRVLNAHSSMSHLASLVTDGVFSTFPGLKALAVGVGAAWVPSFLWRLDYWYKVDEIEAPYLRRLPSEYFRDHVRLGTHSLERPPDPDRLVTALKTFRGMEEMLVYTSCYPDADSEPAASVAGRLPQQWSAGVLGGNAASLFRWPGSARPVTTSTVPAAAAPRGGTA